MDKYLKELGKVFKKLNGKVMPAEIVIVGGASLLINYSFRETTRDVDAYIHASSAMKDAIRLVADTYNLDPNWVNDDFRYTSSYSDKIVECSKYYKTFSGVLRVYTISGSYLIAMKLMSGRSYKYDRSDVVGILYEHSINGDPICLADIKSAAEKLYGSYDAIPEESRIYVEDIFNTDLESAFIENRNMENENKDLLADFENKYENVLNKDNVNEILEMLRNEK